MTESPSNISNADYEEWVIDRSDHDKTTFYIACSGYEARACHWMDLAIAKRGRIPANNCLVIGFKEFAEDLSRKKNDNFYNSMGISIKVADAEEKVTIEVIIREQLQAWIERASNNAITINIDYSCMPRLWYCNLPRIIMGNMRPGDTAIFWYTPGEYPPLEYPTAGVEDFKIFSGRPSLSPRRRTHIFGMGFDRIRSLAIWSVLDPQNLVCFYADPAVNNAYVDRVREENRYVLSAANHIFSVPLTDFTLSHSLISSVAAEFLRTGDVVIVPDGPKPLVLASSLVPSSMLRTGLVCMHVTRRKGRNYKPIDVKPIGGPIGFAIKGGGNSDLRPKYDTK